MHLICFALLCDNVNICLSKTPTSKEFLLYLQKDEQNTVSTNNAYLIRFTSTSPYLLFKPRTHGSTLIYPRPSPSIMVGTVQQIVAETWFLKGWVAGIDIEKGDFGEFSLISFNSHFVFPPGRTI